MEEHDSNANANLSRRRFLTIAGCGAVIAAMDSSLAGYAEAQSVENAGASAARDTGPIAIEHFEAARSRAGGIVAKMTLEEKISQFGNKAPAIPRLNLPAFNFYSSEALHGLIHKGPITSFPLPLAMGCSWNPSLIHRVFTAVSDEVWAWHKKDGQGLAIFSPPTVNMGTRDPRWGRIGENYSEDPLLVAKLAVATIHGIQGDDPRYLKSTACAKHFIANDTEDDRRETSAEVDPRSFWEYYSRGFEACVREGDVFTVMSSYNAMNGIPTTANPFLLTELLRNRWGFRGYVVSDCDAVGDITRTHHFVLTYAEAAALAVNAGCDVNCGGTLPHYLGEAVDEMLISEETIDHSLTRSLTGRILLGDLDSIEDSPYHTIPVSCLESPEHRELCREIGRQSVVLFKNDNNTLPLAANSITKLAVIGPMAATCHLGNYSGKPDHLVSPLDGVLEQFGIQPYARPAEPPPDPGMKKHGAPVLPANTFTKGKVQITYQPGCTIAGDKDEELFNAAVNAARGTDAVLLFVGDSQEIDREGHDRTFLHLPGAQHELAQAVYSANPKTILVISSNCPVSVIWEQEIWIQDQERRKATGVPKEISFQTKPEIALEQICTAVDRQIPSAPVPADAGYGNDTKFREGITEAGLLYMVGIQSSLSVWKPGQAPLPKRKWNGMGRPTKLLGRDQRHQPVTARRLAIGLPPSAWKNVVWRQGTRKLLCSRFAALRVRPAHRDYWMSEPRAEEWLLIEWPKQEAEPAKYWLSTLPADTKLRNLVRLAKQRWIIERDYEELKQELGLGHYEGRGWRGFHHHATLCIAAYGFLVAERSRFSPSARAGRLHLSVSKIPPHFRPRGSPRSHRAA